MNVGLYCCVVGHGYNKQGDIQHVILVTWFDKQWHYMDPSESDFPVDKIHKPTRERVLKLPEIEVICDSNLCFTSRTKWHPEKSNFVTKGTFVGVDGPPEEPPDGPPRPRFTWVVPPPMRKTMRWLPKKSALAGCSGCLGGTGDAVDYDAVAKENGAPCTGTNRAALKQCAKDTAAATATAACAAYPPTAAFSSLCGTLAYEIAGPIFDAFADGWDALTGDAEEEALHAEQLASLAAFDAQVCALQSAQRKAEAALADLYRSLEYHDPVTGTAVAPPWDKQSGGWTRTPRAWIDDALKAQGFLGLLDALQVLANILKRPSYTGKPYLSCTNGLASGNGLDDTRITKGFWQPAARSVSAALGDNIRRLAEAGPKLIPFKVAAEAAKKAQDQQLEPAPPTPTTPTLDSGGSSSKAPVVAGLGLLGLLVWWAVKPLGG